MAVTKSTPKQESCMHGSDGKLMQGNIQYYIHHNYYYSIESIIPTTIECYVYIMIPYVADVFSELHAHDQQLWFVSTWHWFF